MNKEKTALGCLELYAQFRIWYQAYLDCKANIQPFINIKIKDKIDMNHFLMHEHYASVQDRPAEHPAYHPGGFLIFNTTKEKTMILRSENDRSEPQEITYVTTETMGEGIEKFVSIKLMPNDTALRLIPNGDYVVVMAFDYPEGAWRTQFSLKEEHCGWVKK